MYRLNFQLNYGNEPRSADWNLIPQIKISPLFSKCFDDCPPPVLVLPRAIGAQRIARHLPAHFPSRLPLAQRRSHSQRTLPSQKGASGKAHRVNSWLVPKTTSRKGLMQTELLTDCRMKIQVWNTFTANSFLHLNPIYTPRQRVWREFGPGERTLPELEVLVF